MYTGSSLGFGALSMSDLLATRIHGLLALRHNELWDDEVLGHLISFVWNEMHVPLGWQRAEAKRFVDAGRWVCTCTGMGCGSA